MGLFLTPSCCHFEIHVIYKSLSVLKLYYIHIYSERYIIFGCILDEVVVVVIFFVISMQSKDYS